jgi:hypothetical protein
MVWNNSMRDYWMESVNGLSAQVCVFESEFVRKPKTAGRRAIGQSKGCGVSLSGRNLAWVPGKLLSQLPAVHRKAQVFSGMRV